MSRVKIIFPDRKADFETTLSVRVTDINYGNHLANDKLVAMLHESRVLMLSAWQYTEFNIEGAALIQSDLMVRYRNEAFLGDQLHFELYLTNFTSRSFDLLYRIDTVRDNNKVLIAEAKVALVCFDYNTRSTTTVPEIFAAKYRNL